MNAVIYCRRSKESNERTISLKVQEERCREYAARNVMTVVEVITLDGVSGADPARLEVLREALRRTKAQAVVAYTIDRLGRDLISTMTMVKDIWEAGVELHLNDMGHMRPSPETELLIANLLSIAHYVRDKISERNAATIEHLKRQGRRYSRFAPWGFRHVNGRLEEVVTEQAAIRKARELRAQGMSYRVIARTLTEMGWLWRDGGPIPLHVVYSAL